MPAEWICQQCCIQRSIAYPPVTISSGALTRWQVAAGQCSMPHLQVYAEVPQRQQCVTVPDSTGKPGPEPDREHVARIKALYSNSHEATKQRGAFPRDKDIFGDSDTGEVLQIHKSLEEGNPQSPGSERRSYRLINELGPSLHILFIYYT